MSAQSCPSGVLSSRTMIVIRIAMTPSLNASSRVLSHGCRADSTQRETIPRVRLFRPVPRRVARARVAARRRGLGRHDGRRPEPRLPAGAIVQSGDRPRALRDRGASGAASTTAARRSASPSARRSRRADGFEVLEDARLQMSLLGATTPAAIRTVGAASIASSSCARSTSRSTRHRAGAGDRPRLRAGTSA